VRAHPTLVAIVMVLLVAAAPAGAQMPAPAHFESWQPDFRAPSGRVIPTDSTISKGSGSGMVLGGIGGTLMGWLLGGAIGSVGADDNWDGAIYGAMVGATIGVPVGVHMGNHSQGNLLNDMLVSAAIGAAGMLVTSKTQYGWAVLLTPIAQIIATTAMEDRAVRKAAAHDASQ